MKTRMMITLLMLTTVVVSRGQSQDIHSIEQTIYAFAKAGDDQDASTLQGVLDPNYRVVMNQLFGSTEVSILPRSVYLQKIRTKEFGGDKRSIEIQNIEVNGLCASARVKMTGAKLSTVSFIQLVRNAKGQWKLVEDIPTILP